ncbi:Ribonuclease H-like domain containing protein [Trema orientale]|uniref:Ribonuclease H-like domain containing protein n=1 Tax=Trema orientale TaxID=63057 RepID=A0A2P5CX37_TREOI|nr:Ribonuclease H-like domain containing protein [Trema orientale]
MTYNICRSIACSSRLSGKFSAEDAELIAIREGLRFAIDAGLSPSCVESDALKAVSAIFSPQPLAANSPLVSDIKSLMIIANCGLCRHISREENRVAHKLVSFTWSSPNNMYWVESSPLFIASAVLADAH